MTVYRMKIVYLVLCLQTIICYKLSSQNQDRFNIALQGGMGASVSNSQSKLVTVDKTVSLYVGAWYSVGVLGSYTLNNSLGMNVGYQLTEQHHGLKRTFHHPFSSGTEGYGNVTVVGHQVPILFFYKISPLLLPYQHFKIVAGTTLDWLNPNASKSRFRSLINIICGIRYGHQNSRGRIMEVGVQYLRSVRSYTLAPVRYDKKEEKFESFMDVLSLQFYYYLFRQ